MVRKNRESWALGALLERADIKPSVNGPDHPSATGPGQQRKEP
jgi:hypothetical protein